VHFVLLLLIGCDDADEGVCVCRREGHGARSRTGAADREAERPVIGTAVESRGGDHVLVCVTYSNCRLYVVRQKLTTCTQGGAPARCWAQGNDAHTQDAANRHLFPVPGRTHGHGQHSGSPGSGSTVAELVDAVAVAVSQAPPPTTCSSSALHGLMDQGASCLPSLDLHCLSSALP
jgi:hypothetical protein